MKKKKTLILMLSLVCLLVVGIGFAAYTRSFTMSGNVTVNPADFIVNFEQTESTTVDGYTYAVAVSKSEGSDNHDIATITVSGFDSLGDNVTIPVTIKNDSTQYDATISSMVVSYGTNDDSATHIEVIATKPTADIIAGQSATASIKVTLKKTVVEQDVFTFTVMFSASPVAKAA